MIEKLKRFLIKTKNVFCEALKLSKDARKDGFEFWEVNFINAFFFCWRETNEDIHSGKN
ncbi:hypothetical protein [Treponema pectinovorum]|uniref:hypothetical protein n=1 Tax=Treponema pectinovorum TaxID=164 RepID=UPI00164D75E4|nr:hypothetical protein [Treponema pectinovorum]